MESAWKQIQGYIEQHVDLRSFVKYLTDHKWAVLATSSAVLYGLWFFKRPKNLPPGPYGYPIIGSMPELAGDWHSNMKKLGRKYGDIFTLRFGTNHYCVVLNNYDAIKEAYITRGAEFSDRREFTTVESMRHNDTIFNTVYSDIYKTSRKTASQGIRKLMSVKMNQYYEDEMVKFEQFVSERTEPFGLNDPIARVFANVIADLLMNKTRPREDKDIQDLLDSVRRWFKLSIVVFSIDLFLDGAMKGLAKLFWRQTIKEMDEGARDLQHIFIDHIKELQETTEEQTEPRDVIEAYLMTGKFTVEQIATTVLMLLPDAMHTSTIMCEWVFLYLLNYPQYQDKIVEEINEVVGSSRAVSVEDRPKMPVIESFIVEVLRIVTPFPFGIFNHPIHDTTFRGYNLPKYVSVTANYSAVNYDPDIYPEPHLFKPERFVQNGKIGNMEKFIVFGTGRRMCVGEFWVRSNLFMLVASVLQRYKVTSGTGVPPTLLKAEDPIIKRPQPFTVILEKRD